MREYTFDISIHKNNTISVVAESEMEARKEIEDRMESLQDQEEKVALLLNLHLLLIIFQKVILLQNL